MYTRVSQVDPFRVCLTWGYGHQTEHREQVRYDSAVDPAILSVCVCVCECMLRLAQTPDGDRMAPSQDTTGAEPARRRTHRTSGNPRFQDAASRVFVVVTPYEELIPATAVPRAS